MASTFICCRRFLYDDGCKEIWFGIILFIKFRSVCILGEIIRLCGLILIGMALFETKDGG